MAFFEGYQRGRETRRRREQEDLLGLQKRQQIDINKAQEGRRGLAFERGVEAEDRKKTIQNMQLLNQSATALSSLEDADIPGAYQRLAPMLQGAGIDDLPGQAPSRAQLKEIIAATQGVLSGASRSNKFGRVFEAQGEGGKGFYQASDSGDIRQLPGISPTARAAKTVNIGGVLHALNQDTGAVTRLTVDGIPVTPETVGSSEREIAKQTKIGESIGKRTGSAITDLPQILATANDSLATIDNVLKHPGLAGATGLSGVINPANFVPGTEEHDFALASKQLTGQAFLQAFESLKGGGQITETEGDKAQNAIAQLSRKQSTPQYRTAVRTLRDIIVRAKDRAEDAAFEGQSGANAAIGEQEADDFINSIIGQ